MFTCILTERGVIEGPGKPNYYLEDKDFDLVLKDPEIASVLFSNLGDCCLGRIGKPGKDGVYREQKFDFKPDLKERGELCFYEKI